jgi:hypothetical protein
VLASHGLRAHRAHDHRPARVGARPAAAWEAGETGLLDRVAFSRSAPRAAEAQFAERGGEYVERVVPRNGRISSSCKDPDGVSVEPNHPDGRARAA